MMRVSDPFHSFYRILCFFLGWQRLDYTQKIEKIRTELVCAVVCVSHRVAVFTRLSK